ncbi:ATP-dependent endonuclease [Paraburkholderia sp.]|uniref:ATP-dependent nuclease n=1 Tax=Paraburkholderia sp. TaxID=1926495 RepID=UPI0025DD4F40|nr:AAA family ATPase [Paraburkholderia sp.]
MNSLDITFDYPITAFAGVNGAGKSTILALASCAYHAEEDGFKLPRRNLPYYTFSDFFIQHAKEILPQGVEIYYSFAYDKWKSNADIPNGIGIGAQVRRKKKGGKWNDYDSRFKKCVIFLGIERIVPHSERSQSRSYSRSFSDVKLKGWEDKVKQIVGNILGKKYDDFRYLEHSKYSLPLVKIGNLTYSGFNMGAGENALFEIFSTIYSCGQPSLLVLDEIELGLHSKAQRLFMQELKKVCKETGTQVICTTHSRDIYECLPDEARYFVESVGGKTRITQGISADFAFSKMGAKRNFELDVFVEDEVAQALIEEALPASTRSRIKITVIGSATAISRQLAALYVRGEERNTIAVFDGDQKAKESANRKHARQMAENVDSTFDGWFKERIAYLPGTTWPESWIVEKCRANLTATANMLSIEDEADASDILGYGLQAGKHNEFHEIAKHVGLRKDQVLQRLTSAAKTTSPSDFSLISSAITAKLS